MTKNSDKTNNNLSTINEETNEDINTNQVSSKSKSQKNIPSYIYNLLPELTYKKKCIIAITSIGIIGALIGYKYVNQNTD